MPDSSFRVRISVEEAPGWDEPLFNIVLSESELKAVLVVLGTAPEMMLNPTTVQVFREELTNLRSALKTRSARD